MLIRNLAGIFTCCGFAENGGRQPTASQADFIRGPVDIYGDAKTGQIVEIGHNLSPPTKVRVVDGAGKIATPGFVDSHTHAVFAGNRSNEFFRRWAGQSYVEIAKAGGGIASTRRSTAEAEDDHLIEKLVSRLRDIHASGTVAVEVKSGYGCNAADELRLLRIIRAAARCVSEIRVVPTFLGLHAIPEGRTESDYTDEMIAALSEVASDKLAVFADSFPEKGFFSLHEVVRFSQAANDVGLRIKVHADELCDLGTSATLIGMGASSIDHLQNINDSAVKNLNGSKTVATLLPATSFYLGLPYADARKLIHAGARVALATDFNPGTAPSYDMRFTALLAASQLKMSAAEILCAVTHNGAYALGLENKFGMIAPSQSSDLLLFDSVDLASTEPEDILEKVVFDAPFALSSTRFASSLSPVERYN